MSTPIPQRVDQYIEKHYGRYLEETMTLAKIPAPSNHEERRAAWCKNYLESFGAKGVYIDEALNVVYPYECEGKDEVVAFLGHMDVVFPDTDELPLRVEDGKIHCPGIGDNTVSCMAVLTMARMVTEMKLKPRQGILFVANSGEEGLGNLKGVRKIVEDYRGCLKELTAIDGGSYQGICNDAVGSKRYRVELKTEGGHSYAAFGNRNAIYYLSKMVNALYGMKVPPMGKTTYNVGTIKGGTSVNTIAQEAEMLYEFRSNKREALGIMDGMFQSVVEAFRAMELEVNVELVGDRPCKGEVDDAALVEKAMAIGKSFGFDMRLRAGSTDCNIPLSMGIPSICIGMYVGAGGHTREEYVQMDSMRLGLKYLAAHVLSYMEEQNI
jgi:acetylornithine deacetylase/succinyl-diaminopimelate desuccinylase-like protein